MITVELPPAALARVHLTYSPMWELTTSLHLLVHEPESGRHGPWLRWARPRLDHDTLALLRELMPRKYCFPDFLTPAPGPRPRSFGKEIAAVAAADVAAVRRELEVTWDGELPALMKRVLGGPQPMVVLAGALESFWQQVVAPVWPRIRQVLAADLAFRADELAAEGLHALLNRLHPTVTFSGQTLRIDKPNHHLTRSAQVTQLSLVPCAFAWPETLVVVAEPLPVTVSYGPRGAAALWHHRAADAGRAVVDLIGRSRASILSLVDLPVSSTQIADQTGLSLPAVSQHLAVLRRAGLVTTRKAGRTSWSVRTELGNNLLAPGQTER